MRPEYFKDSFLKDKGQSASVLLLVLSAFFGVLILVKLGGVFTAPAKAEQLIEDAIARTKLDEEDKDKYFTESREIADQLKKKNLFAPPPPKKHPVDGVSGILGDEALIKGKWYKVGDKVADAKIVAIEPAQVRIEWEGNEKVFLPIDSQASSESGPSGRERPERRGPGGPPSQRAEMVIVRSEQGQRPGPQPAPETPQQPQGERPGPGEGGFMGGMRERWESMSEEERDRIRAEMRERRERWMNMSDEERERLRGEMRERFGGRGPSDGERGPGGRRSGRGRR